MPHVVVQYTANLDPEARIGALCKTLAEIIVAAARRRRRRVFPIGGTRVLAYPAPHFAVADGAPTRASCTSTSASRPARARLVVARGGSADRRGALALAAIFAAARSASPCRSTRGSRCSTPSTATCIRSSKDAEHARRSDIAALAAELHDAQGGASRCAISRCAIPA